MEDSIVVRVTETNSVYLGSRRTQREKRVKSGGVLGHLWDGV